MEVSELRKGPRAAWTEADDCLQAHQNSRKEKGRTESHRLIEEVYGCLHGIGWHRKTKGFSNQDPISSLARFATQRWLSDANEDQMLDLLRTDIRRDSSNPRILIKGTHVMSKLGKAYGKHDTSYAEARAFEAVREAGEGLSDGRHEQLATVTHRDGHWLRVVVDAENDQILYGDSFGEAIDSEMKTVLMWWTQLHTGRTFTVVPLTLTHQIDGYSCGLLAWNGVAHHLYPLKYPLIKADTVDDGRLEVLLKIMSHHQDRVRVH
ncbi:hypothetical protein FIBSPDRAFT_761876 [Athelia psychrophila]|uniref:Ubiquitin-like protease family profile domain-containing protein n=1 Tax=Athelia psychrophila TaxID=1759441 RepID=A0A165X2Y4_9AGAM|nr:hypothetical protein FIBSPDRAFT_761876 [Fibularhizoctonia sp. CBS 109695]